MSILGSTAICWYSKQDFLNRFSIFIFDTSLRWAICVRREGRERIKLFVIPPWCCAHKVSGDMSGHSADEKRLAFSRVDSLFFCTSQEKSKLLDDLLQTIQIRGSLVRRCFSNSLNSLMLRQLCSYWEWKKRSKWRLMNFPWSWRAGHDLPY